MPPLATISYDHQVSSSIANTGNLPLVLVLSLIKSPDLPFAANTAAQADTAVSYIMLGLWYATLVQMPLGGLLSEVVKVWCGGLLVAGCLPSARCGGVECSI